MTDEIGKWRSRFADFRAAPPLRGTALLQQLLTPEQRRTWDKEFWFLVVGSAGGLWFVYAGQPYKVDSSACIQPYSVALDHADRAIAMKLWLETDEAAVAAVNGRSGHLLKATV